MTRAEILTSIRINTLEQDKVIVMLREREKANPLDHIERRLRSRIERHRDELERPPRGRKPLPGAQRVEDPPALPRTTTTKLTEEE